MTGAKDGFGIAWHVTWVDLQGKQHTEVKGLIAASMLVGQLMGLGVQVIGIRDHAWWLGVQLDQAEVASLSKSPYANDHSGNSGG